MIRGQSLPTPLPRALTAPKSFGRELKARNTTWFFSYRKTFKNKEFRIFNKHFKTRNSDHPLQTNSSYFPFWSVLNIFLSFDQRHYHMTFDRKSTVSAWPLFWRVLFSQRGFVQSFDSLDSHHHSPVHRGEFVRRKESKAFNPLQRLSDCFGDLPTLFARA